MTCPRVQAATELVIARRVSWSFLAATWPSSGPVALKNASFCRWKLGWGN